ncbi:MAG: hypothetical protein HYV32_00680 [Candidatus Kerfeldbacteria bacterium]|nr:hypothetical protein [Candidatus Kerfeldbacteria bacterium]
MITNAYILDWTMNEYNKLLAQLKEENFEVIPEKNSEDVRVAVPFSRVDDFADRVMEHLNAPYNYVDIQYPIEKTTVVIFQQKKLFITNEVDNNAAKKWAIDQGLPVEQADWATSY